MSPPAPGRSVVTSKPFALKQPLRPINSTVRLNSSVLIGIAGKVALKAQPSQQSFQFVGGCEEVIADALADQGVWLVFLERRAAALDIVEVPVFASAGERSVRRYDVVRANTSLALFVQEF